MTKQDFRKTSEWRQVVSLVVGELDRRGREVTVADGFWRGGFDLSLSGGPPVEVRVTTTNRWIRPPEGSQELRRAARLVTVGKTSYRGRNSSRFPEPNRGFDAGRIADAVEEWSANETKRRDEHAERERAVAQWRRQLKKLPKALRDYQTSVVSGGSAVEVTVTATTIEQVRAVLQAALDAGVES